jgi:hypothetical protein
MNKRPEVNIDRAKFPVKTVIAIVWLVISGISIIIGPQLPWIGFTDYQERSQISAILFMITIPIALFWILPCIFLLLRRKWAYITATVLLSFVALASLIATFYFNGYYGYYGSYGSILLPAVCVPLVLIIVDWENYMKMVRQGQAGKNDVSRNEPQQKPRL